jgi:hypothetical protein
MESKTIRRLRIVLFTISLLVPIVMASAGCVKSAAGPATSSGPTFNITATANSIITATTPADQPAPSITGSAAFLPGSAPIPGPPNVLPDASTIKERTSQGISRVSSYYLDRNISVIRSSGTDKSDENNNTIISNMALDIAGHNMRMDNSIVVRMPGQPALPLIENSLYIIGDIMYVQGLFPDKPEMWSKTNITQDYWEMQNQARQLVELLQLSDIEVLSRENVISGDLNIPCDVLKVTPDLEKLWGILVDQPGMPLPPSAPPNVAFSQIVKNSEIKVWVDQTGGFPVKATLNVGIVVSPAELPTLTSAVSMDVNLNMEFSDYNRPISIELPEEAKNAPDLNLQKQQ